MTSHARVFISIAIVCAVKVTIIMRRRTRSSSNWSRNCEHSQSFVIFSVCIIFHLRWICRRCTISLGLLLTMCLSCIVALHKVHCDIAATSGKCLDLKINLYFSFEWRTDSDTHSRPPNTRTQLIHEWAEWEFSAGAKLPPSVIEKREQHSKTNICIPCVCECVVRTVCLFVMHTSNLPIAGKMEHNLFTDARKIDI